ncbi:unnamed protein product [Ambrosiozyma monospora]|uniref:Unnamed protein product n=1 Tax=Ambrosiozyma monospora TaxID=43982 RepID=A0ACB5T9F4_AMBMO|nr:unnamed protein product [Ambrosiozyma monospora]
MSDVYYMEKTVQPSGLAQFYFNDFKVLIKKNNQARYDKYNTTPKQKKVLTLSTWQELTDPSDSINQFDDDDNDEDFEDLLNTSILKSTAPPQDNEMDDNDDDDEGELISVNVFISPTSIRIDNRESILFHTTVLGACVLPGNEQSKYEDSLLVGLKSGLVLLMRIALIDGFVQPIILQKLKLENNFNSDNLLQLGYNVAAFRLGNVVSISAFSRITRLYMVQYNKHGIPCILNPVNLVAGGAIVRSCFFEPVSSNHIALLTLVSTRFNVLQFEYNDFYLEPDFKASHKKVTTLLNNDMDLPYFMISLRNTSCVLLLQEKKCVIMGINRLFSNEGPDYSTCDFLPDKPCSYYIPKQKISCFHSPEYEDPDIRVDQVLISNSSQCMMLLEVFMNTKKPMLSMKLHKLFNQPTLFSKFSMEPIGASEVDYEITYMNEYGIIDSKLATLVPKSNENSGFSMKITEDNGSLVNSFPMFDFKIVQSSKPRVFWIHVRYARAYGRLQACFRDFWG